MKKKLFIVSALLTIGLPAAFSTRLNAATGAIASDSQDFESPYNGDSLTTIGSTVYYFEYAPDDAPIVDDEVATVRVVAVNGQDVAATCYIYGEFSRFGKVQDGRLPVIYGADEAMLDLTAMPASFTMPSSPLKKEMRRVTKSFNYKAVSNAPEAMDFSLEYYTPAEDNVGMNSLIAHLLDYAFSDDEINSYEGDLSNKDEMLNYYSEAYRDLYAYFVQELDKPYACEISVSVVPTWQSAAKDFLTYRLNHYSYTGGAHGQNNIYYLTLGATDFRPLTLTDIFKADAIAQVMQLVATKVAMARPDLPAAKAEAALADSGNPPEYLGACSERIDEWNGKLYPRPALTEKGVVFSYWPYEKGSYADGDLHVLLSYDEVKEMLTPRAAALVPPAASCCSASASPSL
ncbi:MAG: DUF3298 domain-containing protein [Bacteroidales bacterium]|nr:DUF3298 domain-containing protein [Bacteroidales bacterium]